MGKGLGKCNGAQDELDNAGSELHHCQEQWFTPPALRAAAARDSLPAEGEAAPAAPMRQRCHRELCTRAGQVAASPPAQRDAVPAGTRRQLQLWEDVAQLAQHAQHLLVGSRLHGQRRLACHPRHRLVAGGLRCFGTRAELRILWCLLSSFTRRCTVPRGSSTPCSRLVGCLRPLRSIGLLLALTGCGPARVLELRAAKAQAEDALRPVWHAGLAPCRRRPRERCTRCCRTSAAAGPVLGLPRAAPQQRIRHCWLAVTPAGAPRNSSIGCSTAFAAAAITGIASSSGTSSSRC